MQNNKFASNLIEAAALEMVSNQTVTFDDVSDMDLEARISKEKNGSGAYC